MRGAPGGTARRITRFYSRKNVIDLGCGRRGGGRRFTEGKNEEKIEGRGNRFN